MAEPRKARRVDALPDGNGGTVLVRRNRTGKETRAQYMRLYGQLDRPWSPSWSARNYGRLERAFNRTVGALQRRNRYD